MITPLLGKACGDSLTRVSRGFVSISLSAGSGVAGTDETAIRWHVRACLSLKELAALDFGNEADAGEC